MYIKLKLKGRVNLKVDLSTKIKSRAIQFNLKDDFEYLANSLALKTSLKRILYYLQTNEKKTTRNH